MINYHEMMIHPEVTRALLKPRHCCQETEPLTHDTSPAASRGEAETPSPPAFPA